MVITDLRSNSSNMWRFILAIVTITASVNGQHVSSRSGDELVSNILENCIDTECVKQNVLKYLNNLLNIQGDVRSAKNIDATIFKRVAKVLKTYELKFKLPEAVFDHTQIIYNPKSGLDITSAEDQSRGLGLKKKLLFPILLLLKLKMKLLLPLFVALIGLKATKALILSKLAIVIVLGFVIYQLLGKAGLSVPLSMAPAPVDPPGPMYGAPGPSTAPPSSYEPGWEPNQGGPYQRVWTTSNSDPQSLSYSAYYPASSTSSSSTLRP